MTGRNAEIGISLRMIREFDSEREREESLKLTKQEAEFFRKVMLYHAPCSKTVQ